jgi:hypothetical protein
MEDNATETVLFYKGISQIQKCPNRYPYIYEARPYNTLYGPEMSSKPFPYTNRKRVEYPTCIGYRPYTNILDYCRLRKGELDNMGWWTSGTGYIY